MTVIQGAGFKAGSLFFVEGHANGRQERKNSSWTGTRSNFPVKTGTIGPDVVDIATLYKHTGAFTYDPGFTSTASCESKITFIDGDEGVLLHRGYPIDQLAEHGDFLEVCYLLLYGELPTANQKVDFDYRVTRHTMVHEQMSRFFTGFRRDAHPMAVMCGCVGALSAFYHDSNRHHRSASAHGRLDAHGSPRCRRWRRWPTSTMSASPSCIRRTTLIMRPTSCGMCFAVPCEEYVVNPGAGARHGPHLHPACRS